MFVANGFAAGRTHNNWYLYPLSCFFAQVFKLVVYFTSIIVTIRVLPTLFDFRRELALPLHHVRNEKRELRVKWSFSLAIATIFNIFFTYGF